MYLGLFCIHVHCHCLKVFCSKNKNLINKLPHHKIKTCRFICTSLNMSQFYFDYLQAHIMKTNKYTNIMAACMAHLFSRLHEKPPRLFCDVYQHACIKSNNTKNANKFQKKKNVRDGFTLVSWTWIKHFDVNG